MLYTYDDFVAEANKAGVMDRLTESDLQAAQKNPEFGISMVGLMKDISAASTAEQRLIATEAANQLRKNYGVYSAGDGAQQYASSYGSEIDRLLKETAQQGSFQYDPAKDPAWSAYRKAYAREGERASANALAQAAAATGGTPSSYAVTAAQQAANYYAAQLADQLPAMQQNAYQQYLDDFNRKLTALGNYQAQDQIDYDRYLAGTNQKQVEFENALRLYQLLGYATPEVEKALGLNTGGTGTGANTGAGTVTGSPRPAGFNNGSLTEDKVMQLQRAIGGLDVDGRYGPATKAAAGGLSPEDAYAKYVTAAEPTETDSVIPSAILDGLKSSYPEGVVTNETYWQSLVGLYGQAALLAAGFTFGGRTPSKLPESNSNNDLHTKA